MGCVHVLNHFTLAQYHLRSRYDDTKRWEHLPRGTGEENKVAPTRSFFGWAHSGEKSKVTKPRLPKKRAVPEASSHCENVELYRIYPTVLSHTLSVPQTFKDVPSDTVPLFFSTRSREDCEKVRVRFGSTELHRHFIVHAV